MVKKLKSQEKYKFKKGEKVHLDDIYFIQALCGGDWYERDRNSTTNAQGEVPGDELIITRDIEIVINEY